MNLVNLLEKISNTPSHVTEVFYSKGLLITKQKIWWSMWVSLNNTGVLLINSRDKYRLFPWAWATSPTSLLKKLSLRIKKETRNENLINQSSKSPSMDAKIGQFFDSVGTFFSGSDKIPWCDGDVIAVSFLYILHLFRFFPPMFPKKMNHLL